MLDIYIEKLSAHTSLTASEAQQAMLEMLSAQTPVEKIKTYLKTLHDKGETAEEILGTIAALRSSMIEIPISYSTLDIVGTGGDRANTVNISTGAAILAASCGVPIAKHGNRAVSSLAGAADVLEALGLDIHMPIERIITCLKNLNIAFCFAPNFHPALAQLKTIRREMGTPTVLNLIGPLLNPARAQHYLMGVFSEKLLQPFADVLSGLNVKKSAIVHSNGMDEITCSAPTQVIEIEGATQKSYIINPEKLGFKLYSLDALKGGSATDNAAILRDAFGGKPGAVADTLILNAGMGLYLYGKTENLIDGITLARENLKTGQALTLLEQWILFSKEVG